MCAGFFFEVSLNRAPRTGKFFSSQSCWQALNNRKVKQKIPPKPGSHDEIASRLYQAATSVEQPLVTVSSSVYEENLRFEKVRLETIATLQRVSALLVPETFPIQ